MQYAKLIIVNSVIVKKFVYGRKETLSYYWWWFWRAKPH